MTTTYPTPEERRKELDKRIHDYLVKQVAEAQRAELSYAAQCWRCRCMNDNLIRRAVGGACVWDYGFVRKGDAAYCPVCNRCVWSGES